MNFNGTKVVSRVVVYSLQDAYSAPSEPTDSMTFAAHGVVDFTVEGWNGTAWVTLGTVTGNNLVKRTVDFPAFTTDRIRVSITLDQDGQSNITEIEAWGTAIPLSNLALASLGSLASASSEYSASFHASATINGERAGAGFGAGGTWADASPWVYPDWVQVNFNGTKVISRVVVYTLQDAYSAPSEPTDTMTFSAHGLVDFTVEGWNGAAWVILGTVSGNNLVKRTVSFPSFTTDRIRVNVTLDQDGQSNITEIEAWGTP